MKIELKEHTVEKKTHWGTVTKSLNQHVVMIENDNGEMRQCGYVGTSAFLPLTGFPAELVGPVADECEKQLGRKLDRVDPPPSFRQMAEMIAAQRESEQQEDDEVEE